jgi:LmbE family N-acetylglucosaminyl deacetylase
MISCKLDAVKRVLCLGAHSDDIEIGCGGTVLELLRRQPGLEFYWVVFSADARRSREARASARTFLRGARVKGIRTRAFRESYFPQDWPGIKDLCEKLKQEFQPDLVFTHCREDRHQDHRVLSDLAWNTFRHHLILEYEIPKYDGDLGNPNFYVRLDEELAQRKVDHLCAFFQTQGNKHWFTPDTFLALMRLRGIECASATKFAEAFYCRKLVL